MTTVRQIADRYVGQAAGLDPVGATSAGITGFDHLMTDLSPDGFAARADLDLATVAELERHQPADGERAARDAMLERLRIAGEQYDAGETTSDLNVIASWPQLVREVFDLMPVDGPGARADLAARMSAVPAAYAGLRETYRQAAGRGRVAARRQVAACVRQCEEWSAADGGFYAGLAARAGATGAERGDLDAAAEAARAATAGLGRFLASELLPLAPDRDAAGRDRYGLASRYFLGASIDLDEAYAWGWSEVIRIEAEMRAVAGAIVPGGTVPEAVAALEADQARRIAGRGALRDWMQQVADAAVSALDGTHFDIPAPARRIEAMIAPTGDGGVYYTPPSEDWARPGRMWWALPASVDDFSTWKEVTTIYHEGVPGHHLQSAQVVFNSDQLNRWQRLMAWVSGHGEGWALYAERLMDELGFLSDPGDRLGMLDAQLLRAARVVVDLGVHLELLVPPDSPWRPGERWNASLAWEFLRSRVQVEEQALRFELDRYLGWPGQAPSYKLGERIWLQAREEARRRAGAAFDLKVFHSRALALGSIGLDPLRAALAGSDPAASSGRGSGNPAGRRAPNN
ncbi:MAG: DUF885 domain-containing protein [Streptosporangiaceae bacterium]